MQAEERSLLARAAKRLLTGPTTIESEVGSISGRG